MDEKTDAILIIPQGFPSMQLVEIDPTIHGKHEKLEKQLSTSCCPGSNAEVTCLLQHIITIQPFDEGEPWSLQGISMGWFIRRCSIKSKSDLQC
jgi:hypothetical protein